MSHLAGRPLIEGNFLGSWVVVDSHVSGRRLSQQARPRMTRCSLPPPRQPRPHLCRWRRRRWPQWQVLQSLRWPWAAVTPWRPRPRPFHPLRRQRRLPKTLGTAAAAVPPSTRDSWSVRCAAHRGRQEGQPRIEAGMLREPRRAGSRLAAKAYKPWTMACPATLPGIRPQTERSKPGE